MIRRLSTRSTMWFLFAAIGVLIYEAWPDYMGDRFSRYFTPDLVVIRVTERDLEYSEALDEAFAWEKVLLFEWLYSHEEFVRDAIHTQRSALRYCEANQTGDDEDRQRLRAHHIVLLAENGNLAEVRTELEKLRGKDGFTDFVSAIEICYLEKSGLFPLGREHSAVSILNVGWAQEKLTVRLAVRNGRYSDAGLAEERMTARGRTWLERSLFITLVTYLCLFTGLLGFRSLVREVNRTLPGKDLVPWSVADGVGVFVRAEVCKFLIYLALSYTCLRFMSGLDFVWYTLILSLPAIVLMHYHLMRPLNLGWWEHFGFDPSHQRLKPLILLGLGVFALEWIGATAISAGFYKAGEIAHITEWVHEEMIYGSTGRRFFSIIDFVVWAPVFEEIIFRGLLFASLRKRFGFLPSALISSVIFAMVHFYTISGLVGIAYTGFVFALAYEKTRSLIPCIVAHALINFLLAWQEIWNYGI